jgi:hypothetical protein
MIIIDRFWLAQSHSVHASSMDLAPTQSGGEQRKWQRFCSYNSNRAARSKYALFGLAVGIYDVYTSQTSGIHGARESTLCIRNLCTNVNTDHQGEGLAQSRVLFLDKRSIKGLCIW